MSAPTQRPWQLHEVSQPLVSYRPVLALSLLRKRSQRWEVLTGVRTEEANKTHPGVVSVPTMRLPGIVAQDWIDRMDDPGFRTDGTALREVANMLARKLGVADLLELGLVQLRQLDLRAWQGTSLIGEDDAGPISEDLTMFNACVEVVTGSALFPRETASYSPLLWAGVDDFLRMVRTREVSMLNVGLDELSFCAYGLCLTSAARILDGGVPDQA